MTATRFLDTNILAYAFDTRIPAKRAIALKLIEQGWNSGNTAISIQVLLELHAALRKLGVPVAEASETIRDFTTWPVIPNNVDLLKAALQEQARWKISLWDALILAATRQSGATELITEDFNHNQNYGGIKAVNPFHSIT